MNRIDMVDIDLNSGKIFRSFADHTIGEGDNLGDQFGVNVFQDGEPVTLSNAACVAYFIRNNGDTVALTGVISGNQAYVILPQACYAYEGQFALAIKIAHGTANTTVRIVDGTVCRTITSTPIDPGSTIPDLTDLLAQISAMEAATAAANAAASKIAPTFDAGTAYSAGQYVFYNNNLYQFTADHAAGAWTGTDCTSVTVGGELADLNTAITSAVGVELINITSGYCIADNGSIGSVVDLTPQEYISGGYIIKTCSEGDRFTITGSAGNLYRLWVFIDSDNKILTQAPASAQYTNSVITAPPNASKLIVNVYTFSDSLVPLVFSGVAISSRIEESKDFTKETIGVEKTETYKYITLAGKIGVGGEHDHVTDYIEVYKGSIVKTNFACPSSANVLSFYTNKSENTYVSGITGYGSTKEIEYTVEADGYVRLFNLDTITSQSNSYLYVYYPKEMDQSESLEAKNTTGLSKLDSGLINLNISFVYGYWQNGEAIASYDYVRSDEWVIVEARGVIAICDTGFTANFDEMSGSTVVSTKTVTNKPTYISPGWYRVSVHPTSTIGRKTVEYIKNKLYIYSNLNNAIDKEYRYLVPTFYNNQTPDGLMFLGTNDLKTFDLVQKKGKFVASNTFGDGITNTVRDPAIIKVGDLYYFVYTVIAYEIGNVFGLCYTRDFIHYRELPNITVANIPGESGQYAQIWAPDWFRDGEDIYILFTGRRFAQDGVTPGSQFDTVIIKMDLDNLSYSDATILQGLRNHIDTHIAKCNGKYYAVNGGFCIYESDTLTGTYTYITDNTLPEDGYEAPFLMRLDNGKWRLFAQQLNSTFGTTHYCYADSLTEDLADAFGEIHQIKLTQKAKDYMSQIGGYPSVEDFYHFTIHDFNNSNDNNNNYIT